MPTEIKIIGLNDANALIRQIVQRTLNFTPALDAIGRTVVDSILTNFEVGGRPAWPPLKPATIARKLRHPDKVLIESETLMRSISHQVIGKSRVQIGTNVEYARVHQYGLKGAVEQQVPEHLRRAHTRRTSRGVVKVPETRVRAHTRTINQNIPARPFIAVQDDDLREIERIVRDFLTRN